VREGSTVTPSINVNETFREGSTGPVEAQRGGRFSETASPAHSRFTQTCAASVSVNLVFLSQEGDGTTPDRRTRFTANVYYSTPRS
jgi:hypothetical protein